MAIAESTPRIAEKVTGTGKFPEYKIFMYPQKGKDKFIGQKTGIEISTMGYTEWNKEISDIYYSVIVITEKFLGGIKSFLYEDYMTEEEVENSLKNLQSGARQIVDGEEAEKFFQELLQQFSQNKGPIESSPDFGKSPALDILLARIKPVLEPKHKSIEDRVSALEKLSLDSINPAMKREIVYG